MQRVIKRTFNQSSLVDESMGEWFILADSANIRGFLFFNAGQRHQGHACVG